MPDIYSSETYKSTQNTRSHRTKQKSPGRKKEITTRWIFCCCCSRGQVAAGGSMAMSRGRGHHIVSFFITTLFCFSVLFLIDIPFATLRCYKWDFAQGPSRVETQLYTRQAEGTGFVRASRMSRTAHHRQPRLLCRFSFISYTLRLLTHVDIRACKIRKERKEIKIQGFSSGRYSSAGWTFFPSPERFSHSTRSHRFPAPAGSARMYYDTCTRV